MPLRPLRNACLSRLVSLVSLAPVACVALAVMSAACASAARHASSPAAPGAVAARPPASPEATPSLDELRSREASAPLRDFRVRAADGAIELHVKASSPPTAKTKKQADGSAYSVVTFLVGGDVEVSCHATSSAVDPAHWVEAVLDEVHTTLTEAPKVAVEVVDGHPLFLVHTEGTLERGGVQKRHIAKFAAMHLDQGSVACVHDAVGFEATFRDVARHIATASKTPNAERAAYHSISLVRSGDQVVGFEEVHAYEGPKPGEQRQVSVSSVIYGDDERWFTSDTGWFGLVDAKGVARERALSRTG